MVILSDGRLPANGPTTAKHAEAVVGQLVDKIHDYVDSHESGIPRALSPSSDSSTDKQEYEDKQKGNDYHQSPPPAMDSNSDHNIPPERKEEPPSDSEAVLVTPSTTDQLESSECKAASDSGVTDQGKE